LTAPEEKGHPAESGPADSQSKEEPTPLLPTLGAYYSAEKARVVDWLKTLRVSKVTAFTAMDSDVTLGVLDTLDPVLQKTLQLADAAEAPVAVHRWVARVIQLRLGLLIGEAAEGLIVDVSRIARLLKAQDFDLKATDQDRRRYAENFFRLVVGQHLEGRGHLLGSILLLLDESLAKPLDKDTARDRSREMQGKLLRGSLATVATMAATYAFAHEEGWGVRSERDRLRVENGRQQRELGQQQSELDRLTQIQADAEQKIAELATQIGDLKRRHAEQTQVVHHGVSELRTDVRSFLEGRMQPLLSDAVDGVEIALSEVGPKSLALRAAADRLRAVQAALKEEIEWLQSSG
jgi:hypothetical protein